MQTSTPKVQLRGHCQCCGHIQAVTSGGIASHGYTVKHGWFEGVCQGQANAPMEVSTEHTTKMVAMVRQDALALRVKAAAYRDGTATLGDITTGRSTWLAGKRVPEMIPFLDATKYQQRIALDQAAWAADNRANAGYQFASSMESLAERVHGQALVQVTKPIPAAPILEGEARVHPKFGAVTVKYVKVRTVFFSYINKDCDRKTTSCGTKAWRDLPKA